MWVRLLSVTMLLLGLMLLVCKLPSPPPGPENAFVAMEFKNSSGVVTKEVMTDSIGKKFHICLIHNLTQYVDSSVLIITKGSNIQEVISIRSFKGQVDTTYYPVLFSDTGIYTVSFTSYIEGKTTELKGKINIVGQPLTTQNQKPVLSLPKDIVTGAGQELVIPVSATDPDVNQQVTIIVIKKPESATFNANLFTWTPALEDTGSVTVKFTATDNGSPALSVTDSCVIVVSATAVNRAPKWKIKSIQSSTLPEVLFSLDVSSYCIDPDKDNLTFSLLTQTPAKGTIAGNLYQFTPAVTDTGLHTISIVASDPSGLSDTLTLELTVSTTTINDDDTTKPALTRVTPSGESTSTNVSSYIITVNCTDASGIANVVGTMGTQTFAGTKGAANVWTIAITGLSSTVVNSIAVTATDSSLRANKSTLPYSITYDPTGADNTPPHVYFTNPVKDTVVGVDSCTVTAVCVDPSKISSLVGKLETTTFSMNKTAVDSIWTGVVKGLPSGSFATIKLIATDDATARNKDSVTVRIKYDGDATMPALTRVTPAGESASTNASSYTITVNCTDASGVVSVVGTMGTQTFTGIKGAANEWTIAVTGLSSTAANAVVISATDSSLRANKSTLNYSITYDPTMLDTIGPTITDVSGPASGSTVTAAVVDIVKGISDPSGIDSVYWTKNGGAKKVMSPVTGNADQYSLKDTLTEGRGDTLVITSVDKATKHNLKTQTIVLKYVKAPAITVQPVSQTICSGSQATFSVTATGTAPLSYQWRTGSTNPVNISGANSSTYSPGTTTADQTVFSCVVSNGSGVDVTSNSCTLKYYAPPTITGPNNQTVCSGNATLSVSVTDATGYQWYNGSTSGSGTAISGATSATYSAPAGSYWCKVSYGTGCSANSSVAMVSVTATPTITGPSNQSVCSGNATLSVTVTGATGYQWYNGSTSGSGTAISGATLNTYSAPEGSYWCKVSYGSGCSVNSSVAKVTVTAAPTITGPSNQSVCSGSNATLSVSVTGATGFQWYNGGTSGSGTAISGATSASYSAPVGSYWCKVSYGTGCTTNSSVATVSAIQAPTISKQPVSQSSCPGENVIVYFSVSSNGVKYQWKKDGVSIHDDNTNYYGAQTYKVTVGALASNVGEYTCDVSNSDGCTVSSNPAQFTLTKFEVTNPKDLTLCEGDTAAFTVTSECGSSFEWWQRTFTGEEYPVAKGAAGEMFGYYGQETSKLEIRGYTNSIHPAEYFCEVSDGTNKIRSMPASLTKKSTCPE